MQIMREREREGSERKEVIKERKEIRIEEYNKQRVRDRSKVTAVRGRVTGP